MASRPRKRRAEDQLSPYSKDVEEERPEQREFKGNKPKVRRKPQESISTGELFTVKNDKVAGLNRCFQKAVQTVLLKESNKDLTYLFDQYKTFLEEINKHES